MGKGLLFFCCACCILVLTIVNLSIGPIVSGTVKRFFSNGYGDWGTLNCEGAKDAWDADKDDPAKTDDQVKYTSKYWYDTCQRAKGMHDMEYTSFIFDIVIGFICGLLGLLHLFDLKKDFVSNTGLIGLICGIVGFAFTFVYVVFNGLVYTTVYVNDSIAGQTYGIFKRDGDYVIAEKDGDNFKCLYFDHEKNGNSIYPKISDLGKKQYNYDKDGLGENTEDCQDNDSGYRDDSNKIAILCARKETYSKTDFDGQYTTDGTTPKQFNSCDKIYISESELTSGISNKDLSDRFLTTLILSLFVCLASIGLALFGFLLFRTPGDF